MLAGEGTIREKSLYNVFPCSLLIPIVVVQFPYFSIVFSIIPIVPLYSLLPYSSPRGGESGEQLPENRKVRGPGDPERIHRMNPSPHPYLELVENMRI